MAEELNRWLRRVRPSTAADDEAWADSSDADQVLAGIHRQTATGPRARLGRIRPVRWLPAAAIAGVAATVVTVALTNTPTPSPVNHGPGGSGVLGLPQTVIKPASFLLNTEPTCDGLLAQLRSHAVANVQAFQQVLDDDVYYQGVGLNSSNPGAALAPGAPIPSNAQASSPNTSTTNVQEVGVDEPDIVKTDGNRLVTITDGVLRVVDTTTRTVTGSLDLTVYSGAEGAQLLVDGSHALVTLTDSGAPSGPMVAPNYRGIGAGTGQSTYLFVNLDGQPTVTGSLRASGSFLDARMIGSTVRLVVRSTPVINLPAQPPSAAATTKTIREAPLSAWLPKYTITSGATKTSKTVPCNRISHPSEFTGTSMITVYTLDMNHLATDPSPVTVAADGDTVYANPTSLYIASNPQWFCCSVSTRQNTEVHRFDITGTGSPTYLGSAVVPGRLLSSYSLSDSNGYLRVATTTGNMDGSQGDSNDVYVLADDTLKLTGHVGGLGKNERIYAVRFMGPMAYVVTYQQTDPLYVLDLSDPTDPKVVGALTISGVSNYLHDLGGGRLLGVGRAITAGEGSGVQVSLFNVSSRSALKRIGNLVVPNAPGALAFDPHTFLYWQPTGLVVVPVQTWSGTQSGRVLVARVSGDKLSEVGLLANPATTNVPDDGLGIQRSMIVNGDLWTVSGGGVQVSQQSGLHRIAWIPYTA